MTLFDPADESRAAGDQGRVPAAAWADDMEKPDVGEVEDRYGLDPERVAAKSWLWEVCRGGDAEMCDRLALVPTGEYLEVICRGDVPAALTKRANYVGGVRSTVADFTYAYWRPIGA